MASRSKSWTRRSMSLAVVFIFVAVLTFSFVKSESQNEEDGSLTNGNDSAQQNDSTAIPDPSTSSEVNDLDPKGSCSEEIKNFCEGNVGSFVDCISNELKNQQAGNDLKSGNKISESCKVAVRNLKIAMYKDPTLSVKMETACIKDINETCSDGFFPRGILACLRENKEKLSQACQDEVFVAEQDAANDFKMDPALDKQCGHDAEMYCKSIAPEGGQIQACLRDHSSKISYACKAELFRQEQENAGDLRLNVQLYKVCLNDKKKFCPNVLPGNARIKDCLEQYRLEPDFSASCKLEFDKMLARRASDFRLDPILRDSCREDIQSVCGSELDDLTDLPNEEPRVIHCLQDFQEDLSDPQCKREVHKVLVRAAEDYHFDKFFSDSCEDSRQKLCNGVENDKVLSCLQMARDDTDANCRDALFGMESRLSGDIDYKVGMKKACTMEITNLCQGLQHDHGAIIDCLQQKIDHASMGEDCKKEVILDELESAKDYRLNYRIYTDCFEDVMTLCPVAKVCGRSEPCGGMVMKCLQVNISKIKSETCKKDVFSFELKEAKNLELNIPLQKACKDDLKHYCSKRVTKDHSQTLSCLRANRNKLTSDCKEEELRFSMMEASDIRLTPSLMNACGAELSELCASVSPSKGDAFKCLQLHLENVQMGTPCKIEVNLQEARQSSDYRLDVRVRTECQKDVQTFCSDIDKNEEGHAPVLKCFVAQYKNLSGGCQTEVAYAVRMALWQYQFGANLTFPCDSSVQKLCNSTEVKAIEDVVIGTYGQCLTTQKRKKLTKECKALIRVATREGSYIGANTEADLEAAIAKVKELRGGDVNDLSHSGVGFFWVTTTVAFAAMLGVALFKRYSGPPKTYTLVVKGGDV